MTTNGVAFRITLCRFVLYRIAPSRKRRLLTRRVGLHRTRNSIVTQSIVETINGGSLGRSGELRVMKELLKACNGRSSSVYREFCVRVLVPHDKLVERLDYEEGMQLYEEAIAALPYPDK